MANTFTVVNVDTNDYLLKLYGDAPLSIEISSRATLYTDDGGETGGIYLPDGHGLTWNHKSRFADVPTSDVMKAVAREGVIGVRPRATAPSSANLVQNRIGQHVNKETGVVRVCVLYEKVRQGTA
ncbi:MAG: hypothetical protein K0U78_06120 [Actinomycetia bacterium]|nr:hypothetical protein [Actinomycetes bacterium]